jgi:hypothetical protein
LWKGRFRFRSRPLNVSRGFLKVRNALSQGYVHRRILAFLVAVEFLLFLVFYSREIAWCLPLGYDQAEYLTQTYLLQEQALWQGPGKLWNNLWSSGHATGVGLPIEGAITGVLFGGTRLPQLFVLFFAFILSQLFAFYVAHAVCRRREYGYIAVGFILCQPTAWFRAGGLFDFRIDFFRSCAFSV